MGVLEKELRLNTVMEQVPTNLTMDKSTACELRESVKNVEMKMEMEFTRDVVDAVEVMRNCKTPLPKQRSEPIGETKIQLSFSVDRLLSGDTARFCEMDINKNANAFVANCEQLKINEKCESTHSTYCCCTYPNCLAGEFGPQQQMALSLKTYQNSSLSASISNELSCKSFASHASVLTQPPYLDFKSIVRPTPIRAIGGSGCETVPLHTPYTTIGTTTLLRFHQQKSVSVPHPHLLPLSASALGNLTAAGIANQHGLKALHNSQHQQQQPHYGLQNYPLGTLTPRFPAALKAHHHHHHNLIDIPMNTTTLLQHHQHQQHQHQQQQQQLQQQQQQSHQAPTHLSPNHHAATPTQLQLAAASGGGGALSANGISIGNHNNGNGVGGSANGSASSNTNNNGGKRKRSWSRAVFSNLQRKGLEIQFQQQKYITKPDRRKLAARLNLTDAQVKVWFQNRRMKWRHTRENLKSGQEKQVPTTAATATTTSTTTTTTTVSQVSAECDKQSTVEQRQDMDGYTSDDTTTSIELSENEDEIDVVQ